MKIIYSLLLMLYANLMSGQFTGEYWLKSEFELVIGGTAQDQNLLFKLRTCPLVDSIKNSIGIYIGKDLFSPPVDVLDYRYRYEIIPWPVGQPYMHYYLLKRLGNKMYNVWTDDSITSNIPCDKYYPFDEQFLIEYDTITKKRFSVAGNLLLDKMSTIYPNTAPFILALKAAELRTAQYNVKLPIHELPKNHTEQYYEFSARKSDLSKSWLLIRVGIDKGYYSVGQTWEMIYFSNSKAIPGNEKRQFYEVKYTRTAEPKSIDELYPKYRKLELDEANIVSAKYPEYIVCEGCEHLEWLPDFKLLYSDDWAKAYDKPVYDEIKE